MKTVLVTGSAGLVGSACVDLFTEKGWNVIGIDNNARARNLGTPEKVTQLDLDFTDAGAVFHLFRSNTIDAVIHAGGQASHDWSNEHVIEDFMTNAFGTVILLEATRMYAPEATFIQVSTDKVYGENMEGKKPFKEDLGLDFAGHRSPFGCSKTTGDIYAQEYWHTFGIKTGIFRPGCITGKNHEGAELHGFLAYLAKCIRTGTTYKIFGHKGKQVRDQIHAKDLANAFYHFIEKPRPGEVYNIGGGPERSVSILEAIEMIKKHLTDNILDEEGIIVGTAEPRIKTEFHEPRPGDRVWDVHDVSKFRSHYPEWEYQYSLQDIIKDVCSKEL